MRRAARDRQGLSLGSWLWEEPARLLQLPPAVVPVAGDERWRDPLRAGCPTPGSARNSPAAALPRIPSKRRQWDCLARPIKGYFTKRVMIVYKNSSNIFN